MADLDGLGIVWFASGSFWIWTGSFGWHRGGSIAMERQQFRCRHCKRIRVKRHEEQQYCGDVPCQKARKNAWRRQKYKLDADYRANQASSTQSWLDAQGGSAVYFRDYRMRRKQRRGDSQLSEAQARNEGASDSGRPTGSEAPVGANSDVKTAKRRIKSGRYTLSPYGGANSDAILVDLNVISTS